MRPSTRIAFPLPVAATLLALVGAIALLAAESAGLRGVGYARAAVDRLHFRETLLDGLLPFLLFAGALDVDLDALMGEKLPVGLLATAGVLVSTAIVGALVWATSKPLGLATTVGEALLFGALISPTDPIAVLGMLRASATPKRLDVQLAGESLFNDGFGVVVFFAIAELTAHRSVAPAAVGLLLVRQVAGGMMLGYLGGRLARAILRRMGFAPFAALVTLGLTVGVFWAAKILGLSGLLAVIVAGLLVSRSMRSGGPEASPVAERLREFWTVIDGVLNVGLFGLIGLEALIVPFTPRAVVAGLVAVPVVIVARLVVVGGTLVPLAGRRGLPARTIPILTWGGLRGGLALALALALEPDIAGAPLLTMTYVVVVFSIVVQGLTFRRLLPPGPP
ncbi:MAG TPA: cation:proton antiporter [Polyangia bacterium]|nr:cation:proton antiporter [Polyangia bacterium]